MRDSLQFHLFAVCALGTALLFLGWYLWLVLSWGAFFDLRTVLGVVSTAGLGAMAGVFVVYQVTLAVLGVQRRWRDLEVVTGCRVRILGGPRRGEVARVYESWEMRGEVRLELGEEAQRTVTDVYRTYQVRRVPESKESRG